VPDGLKLPVEYVVPESSELVCQQWRSSERPSTFRLQRAALRTAADAERSARNVSAILAARQSGQPVRRSRRGACIPLLSELRGKRRAEPPLRYGRVRKLAESLAVHHLAP